MKKKNINMFEEWSFVAVLVMGVLFSLVLVSMVTLTRYVWGAKGVEQYILEEMRAEDKILLRLMGAKKTGVNISLKVEIFDEENMSKVWGGDVIGSSVGNEIVELVDERVFESINDMGSYTFLVKGEKHRQLKFESVGYADGLIDLSYREIAPGDLPWGGAQDGVVDMSDYEAVIQRLGSREEEDLIVADVDMNGVVDSMDRSLVQQTLLETK